MKAVKFTSTTANEEYPIVDAGSIPKYDESVEPIEETLARLAAEVPQEEWDKVAAEPEIEGLREQLALTEKALKLACGELSIGCPESYREVDCLAKNTECVDCWKQYFIEKAKEKPCSD